MTVSNVLRGRGVVAAATRERVLEAARTLSYIPVRATRQQYQVKTHVISMVVAGEWGLETGVNTRVYTGLCNAAREHDYNILTLLRQGTEEPIIHEHARFLDRHSDGFIFLNNAQSDWEDVWKSLSEHQIPTVVCLRTDLPEGIASINPDDREAMRLAVHHLVEMGHRRIAFVSGLLTHHANIERHFFFREAMGAHGLEAYADRTMTIYSFNPTLGEMEHSSHVVEDLEALDVTAAVCFDDYVAHYLRHEMEKKGLRVPEDYSVIGVNDDKEAEPAGLTTIAFSAREIGRRAVESLLKIMEGTAAQECHSVVPVELICRSSVAPVAVSEGNKRSKNLSHHPENPYEFSK